MTAPAFVAAQTVRDYLNLESTGSSAYVDSTVLSNVRTASEFLEKATNRYFANRTGVTLTLTSNGEAVVDLPGVRSVTSVTRAGSGLVANESYWLIPDAQQSGVYTGLQVQPFANRGGSWWLSVHEWWDRNLDSAYYPANWSSTGSMPNDLVIVADVGYVDGTLPEALLMATKVLAAWYTKRPDAVLSGASATPDGNALPLEDLPPEVSGFVSAWKIGSHSAVSLG